MAQLPFQHHSPFFFSSEGLSFLNNGSCLSAHYVRLSLATRDWEWCHFQEEVPVAAFDVWGRGRVGCLSLLGSGSYGIQTLGMWIL